MNEVEEKHYIIRKKLDKVNMLKVCKEDIEKFLLFANLSKPERELFCAQTEDGFNCLNIICNFKPKYLEKFLNSQVMDQELFDLLVCNTEINCFSFGRKNLEVFFRSRFMSSFNPDIYELLWNTHIFKNLFSSYYGYDLQNLVLDSPYMTQELFDNILDLKMTCIHYASTSSNSNILEKLLESPYMTQEIFDKEDFSGKTCIHFAVGNPHSRNNLNILLSSQYMTQKLFEKVNRYGNTCFHYTCYNNFNNIDMLINSPFMTQKIFSARNNEGRTILHYICADDKFKDNKDNLHRYFLNLLKSPYITKELINTKDRSGRYVFSYIDNKYVINNLPRLYLLFCNEEHLVHIKKKFSITKTIIEIMKNAVVVINNFMFKMYYRPGGIHYKKIESNIL